MASDAGSASVSWRYALHRHTRLRYGLCFFIIFQTSLTILRSAAVVAFSICESLTSTEKEFNYIPLIIESNRSSLDRYTLGIIDVMYVVLVYGFCLITVFMAPVWEQIGPEDNSMWIVKGYFLSTRFTVCIWSSLIWHRSNVFIFIMFISLELASYYDRPSAGEWILNVIVLIHWVNIITKMKQKTAQHLYIYHMNNY